MDFARDWKRLFNRSQGPAGRGGVGADPALTELLTLHALTLQSQGMTLAVAQAGARERPGLRLELAAVLHEIARRSGRAETLLQAAGMAARAAAEGSPDQAAAARGQQALCALLTTELFGDAEGATAGEAYLAEAGPAGEGVSALLAARAALAASDLDRAIQAAERLDALVATGGAEPLAVEARLARADLLVGFGRRLGDRALLQRAQADLAEGLAALDADYRPVSWARMEGLRGQALAGLGELDGEADLIARGCAALAAAAGHVDAQHSPLDHARTGHALAVALLALAQASEGESRRGDAVAQDLADQALAVLGPALAIVERVPGLPLRALVAHDRASAVARRAERRGDRAALADAEHLFRGELSRCDARLDPIGWAVTQVGLARVYEAQQTLDGPGAAGGDPAMALASAFDVFAERGLKSLAETASAALRRVAAPV